jgi:hypothetical protein
VLVFGKRLATEIPPPRPVGPYLEVVRIAKVDSANGTFTIVRTTLEYVSQFEDVDVPRDGRTVKERRLVTAAKDRESREEYTLKHWRLTNKRGAAADWEKTVGKAIVLHRSNQLPDNEVLKLLSKDAIILYGRD